MYNTEHKSASSKTIRCDFIKLPIKLIFYETPTFEGINPAIQQ